MQLCPHYHCLFHKSLGPVSDAGLPAGACISDRQCPSGQQCSRVNTTTVCGCNGGLDTCRDMGSCVAKPPPVAPCTRCSNCLSSVAATLAPVLAAGPQTAAALTDATAAWCATQAAYSANACDALVTAVRSSLGGSLALRAGAVCDKLSACRDCTDALTLGSLTGLLDVCTAEGVASGSQLPGVFAGTGEPGNSSNILQWPGRAGLVRCLAIDKLVKVLLLPLGIGAPALLVGSYFHSDIQADDGEWMFGESCGVHWMPPCICANRSHAAALRCSSAAVCVSLCRRGPQWHLPAAKRLQQRLHLQDFVAHHRPPLCHGHGRAVACGLLRGAAAASTPATATPYTLPAVSAVPGFTPAVCAKPGVHY
jgi:hypothetical protein